MSGSIPPVPICLHGMHRDNITFTFTWHHVPNDLKLSSTLQWEYQISELIRMVCHLSDNTISHSLLAYHINIAPLGNGPHAWQNSSKWYLSNEIRTLYFSNKSPTRCNNFPVYYHDVYSSTCFGRFPAHHQELNDCSGSLWFFLRIVVIVMLCSWSGRLVEL